MPDHVTIAIRAEVCFVQDTADAIGDRIQVGDSITGAYRYNPLAVDSRPSDPNIGSYQYHSAPFGFELKLNDYEFRTNPHHTDFEINLLKNVPAPSFPDASAIYRDEFYLVSRFCLFDLEPRDADPAPWLNAIRWGMVDYSRTALTDTNLTREAPDLTRWTCGMSCHWDLLLLSYAGFHPMYIGAHVSFAKHRG